MSHLLKRELKDLQLLLQPVQILRGVGGYHVGVVALVLPGLIDVLHLTKLSGRTRWGNLPFILMHRS